MKKRVSYVLSAVAVVFFMSSCQKEYICTCNVVNKAAKVKQEASFNVKAKSGTDAMSKCSEEAGSASTCTVE
jgi:hypothetical protein